MRLSILSIIFGLVFFGHPLMSLRAAPPDTLQRASIQRVYAGQPKQLTALQFKDPQTGEVLNTVDITKYNPFRYANLPVIHTDTTVVTYGIPSKQALPPNLLQEYNTKYKNASMPMLSMGSRFIVLRSPQLSWTCILYGLSVAGTEGTLIERSKLVVFSPDGTLHWELPVSPTLYHRLVFSQDDSLLAFAYFPGRGFPSAEPQGIRILNLFKKNICVDYQASDKNYLMGPPIQVGNDLFYAVEESHNYKTETYTIFDCHHSIRYQRTFSRGEMSHIAGVTGKGIIYREPRGKRVIHTFDTTFQKEGM